MVNYIYEGIGPFPFKLLLKEVLVDAVIPSIF
jgi:hypothetical protein